MLRGLATLLCVSATASAVTAGPGAGVGATHEPADSTVLAPAPFRPLPFFYDLYTFRGDGDGTAVIASFAVPAGELQRERDEGETRYRFDVTLVLADTALRSVSRTDDSVMVSIPSPLSNNHLLYTHVEVVAPPSATTLQRVIMTDASTPGIGQLYEAPFNIPDYSGDDLMISDIALGQPDANAGWRRGEALLALLPTSQFPQGDFEVYYEVYNLPFDHRYATEIAIEPVEADGGGPREGRVVRTTFAARSTAGDDGTQNELRHLAAELDKGPYRLTVTVRDDDTGRTASRSRSFHVRGWTRGATMIHARPRGIRLEAS